MDQIYEDASAWRVAQTFEDLCELTAQFVEGKIQFIPGYGASSLDEESVTLVSYLTAFNRAGFMTDCSQPAVDLDNEGYGQRAFVTGFAKEAVAKRIATLTLYTELLVFIAPPEVQWGYQIPVTLDCFHPFSWCGGLFGENSIVCYTEACSGTAMSDMAEAWQVAVVDMMWGRKDYLWKNLTRVLSNEPNVNGAYSVEPSDPNLDTDFIF